MMRQLARSAPRRCLVRASPSVVALRAPLRHMHAVAFAATTLTTTATTTAAATTPRLAALRALAPSTTTRRSFASLPPHELMGLPALSPTMEKGNLLVWRKKEGDRIKAGEIIAEIETDKATMEFEAQDSAVLAKILVPAGTTDLAVGTAIAVTVKDPSHVAAFATYAGAKSAPAAPAPAAPAAAAPAAAAAAAAAATPATGTRRALPAGFAVMGMPALSPTMEQGNLTQWRKKEGDKLKAGEILADIETDKATMEFENQEKGKLAKILLPSGSTSVKVGQAIAIVATNDAADLSLVASFTAADFGDAPAATVAAAAPAAAAAVVAPTSQASDSTSGARASTPVATSGGAVNASPFVRAKLRAAGVSASLLPPGSGPNRRLIERDIAGIDLKALSAAPLKSTPSLTTPTSTTTTTTTTTSDDYEVVPHSNIRRVTAQRLTESKQQVPHYYLTMEMNVDAIIALRDRVGKSNPDGAKPSLNDFVVRAAAAALRSVPDVNSSWTKDAVLRHRNVDICVAVATDRGLLTPIVHDADQLGVNEIAATVRSLAGRAREGKLKPHEFQGGTFTISNLGMYGISQFTAVINPPQAAILAVGATEKRVVPGKDGGVAVANVLTVTLSCDHRVIDGAVGATWLQAFKRCMEDPINMVL